MPRLLGSALIPYLQEPVSGEGPARHARATSLGCEGGGESSAVSGRAWDRGNASLPLSAPSLDFLWTAVLMKHKGVPSAPSVGPGSYNTTRKCGEAGFAALSAPPPRLGVLLVLTSWSTSICGRRGQTGGAWGSQMAPAHVHYDPSTAAQAGSCARVFKQK